jgi:hypothetical protein
MKTIDGTANRAIRKAHRVANSGPIDEVESIRFRGYNFVIQ